MAYENSVGTGRPAITPTGQSPQTATTALPASAPVAPVETPVSTPVAPVPQPVPQTAHSPQAAPAPVVVPSAAAAPAPVHPNQAQPAQERRDTSQPIDRLLGHITSVDGAYATIAATAADPAVITSGFWAIGRLISITVGANRVIGMDSR